MEWHLPPVSRKSRLTERPFEEGDRVASALVRRPSGDLERVDVLEAESDQAPFEGEPICRWTVTFKPKPDDGKEEAAALELTAENLFASLFEGEQGPSRENAQLKHFLALMLERRRTLRLEKRGRSYDQYVRRSSKERYHVPVVELDPDFFLENQRRLDFLLAGGDEEAAASGAGSNGS